MNATKRCQRCKEVLPFSAYNKDKSRGDGYACTCRKCVHIYQKDHYQRNRENILSKAKRNRWKKFTKVLYDRGSITETQNEEILSWLQSGD